MRSLLTYGLVAVLGIPLAGALQGCASAKHAERDPVLSGPTVQVYESATGYASYYSHRFHGHKTASGERYNRKRLTAAHPRYPFGTWLRVTADQSGRTVVVRVNDRGPRQGNRILDLSFAAAAQLGIIRAGVAEVRVEVIDWPDQPLAAREGEDASQNGKRVGDGGR